MRRRTTAICLALAALVALAAAPAATAKKRSKRPVITRVTPMRVHLGERLTIRGRRFSSRRRRNTVIFQAPSGRSAFVKPRRATRRKLVLRVSPAVGRLLAAGTGGRKTTRMKLRVVVRRKFSSWTRKRLSPVVVSGADAFGGGEGGSSSSCVAGDFDGDLLSGDMELAIGTDPCLVDTDGDGVEDGYEEQSAIDLNHYPRTPPLPYPGKRPYPNALDPSDRSTDYDGDAMTLREEFLMWMRFSADGVHRSGRPTTLSGLLYSDGLQKSIDPAPLAPANALDNWSLDLNEDGRLTDDERDVDADGLSNVDEAHLQFTEAWWPKFHDGNIEPKESKYPGINFLDNGDLPDHDAYADSDIDGDGVLDGADDADHDGLSNEFEVRRPGDWYTDTFGADPSVSLNLFAGSNRWAYTNPFNPCKPFNSERCHRYPPIAYYDGDEVPPIGPNPPAGYPSVHPATPNN